MPEPGINSAEDFSKPQVGMVPKEHVILVWPGVEELLRERMAKWLETVSEAEVYGWLLRGDADLWLAMQGGVLDGFVIGQWQVHDRAKYYHIVAVAGSGLEKYFKQGLRKIEQFACMLGAKELVFEGRPGWVRLLKRYGYVQDTIRMKKPVRQLWSN